MVDQQPSPPAGESTPAFPGGWWVAVLAVVLAVVGVVVFVVLPGSDHPVPVAAASSPSVVTTSASSPTPLRTTTGPAMPTSPTGTAASQSSPPPSVIGTRSVVVGGPVAGVGDGPTSTLTGRLVAVPGPGEPRNCLGLQTADGVVIANQTGTTYHVEFSYDDAGRVMTSASGIFTGDFAAGTSRAAATIGATVRLEGTVGTATGDLSGQCGIARGLYFTRVS